MPLFALIDTVISSNASKSAAQTQANAAEQAAKIQQGEFNTTTANEAPFLQGGQNTLAALLQGLGIGPQGPGGAAGVGYGSLTAPFNWANLQNTPGYQFQMSQGLQALLDSATATGGVSGGNTLKSLVQYGQGLADTTGQQQFSDYLAQQGQQFGELQTVAGSGQNAAAQLGALGNQSASTVGQDLIGGANATAAGKVGSANAVTSGINNAQQNALLAFLLNSGGGASAAGAGAGAAGFDPNALAAAFGG